MNELLKKITNQNYLLSKFFGYVRYLHCKHKKFDTYLKLLDYTEDKKLLKDAFFSEYRYNIMPIEYFLYGFSNLNDKGRKEFIGNGDRKILLDGTGDLEAKKLIDDKYELYKKFKKAYNREMIVVNKEEYTKFYDFVNKHERIIVKPYDAMQGAGIRIIEFKQDLVAVFEDMFKNSKTYVLEELIVQEKALGDFHPKSINTIRFATYYNSKKDKVYNAFAFIRFGVGEMAVDNLAAGGISAIIDVETGLIITPAMNMKLENYIIHPDSKKTIVGYQIPEWEQLKELVQSVAIQIKNYNYISWDFALTEKGWVIVEANSNGGLYTVQMHGQGIRKKMEKCINN